MTTMASERSWLLDPSLLKLVHQCRRLIRSEFGVKLHLTEDRLAQRLANYAEQSRSADLAQTWAMIRDQVPSLALELDCGTVPKRTYRGQVIAEPEAADTAPETTGSAHDNGDSETPGRKKMVYRGQVIYQ